MMGNIYSVAQVNTYIRNMFAQDFMLHHIRVRGEVSNCKYHTSGHIFFTLKDASGTIAAIMFAGNRGGLAFRMKDGDKVIVTGSVEVYERDGKYQLYAREITREGAGDLWLRFEERKRELEEMGMFAAEYKRPVPRFATRIGIVTAATGAAIQDIRNIAARRNPYVQLFLYSALVQGEGAAADIARGIRTLDAFGVDVLIVGRGGGSIEELWAFNEVEVARAIFECETPVISAVGHETDTTIADFVADLRAPTPSAAAELAVFDFLRAKERLASYESRLQRLMRQHLTLLQMRAAHAKEKLRYLCPENRLREKRRYTADLAGRLDELMERRMQSCRHRLALMSGRLEGLSPVKKLAGGFSYVEDQNGRAVTDASQTACGEELSIHLYKGSLGVTVTEVRSEDGRTGETADAGGELFGNRDGDHTAREG